MAVERWQYERIEAVSRQYRLKVRQFGLEVLSDRDDEFRAVRAGFVGAGSWALANAGQILTAINNAKPFTIMIGMRPNRAFHLGHLTLMRELAFLIERGGVPLFVLAAYEAGAHATASDIEACMLAFQACYRRFIEDDLPDPLSIVSDIDSLTLRKLEDRVAEHLTSAKLRQLYGWSENETVATMRKASMTAAAFLLPSSLTPGRPALILTDINQAPHAEATKIAGRAMKLRLPGYSYRMLMPGLLGPGQRMSVKNPRSLIQLSDSKQAVQAKLKASFSGGRATQKEQAESGGQPEICSFFRAAEALGDADNTQSIYRDCVSGKTTCAQCKACHIPTLTARFADE